MGKGRVRQGEMIHGGENGEVSKGSEMATEAIGFCFGTKLKRCTGHPGTRHMLWSTTS